MNKEGYHIIKEGYLLKESYYFKHLRKRWIVLNKQYLDCYKDNVSDHTTEAFDLTAFCDVRASIDSKPYQFELIPHEIQNGKPIRVFVASSIEEMNEWIYDIKQCMDATQTDYKRYQNIAYKTTSDNIIRGSIYKVTDSTDSITNYDEETNHEQTQNYTESDIKHLSIWYSKELHKLEQKHHKEKDVLMSRIDGLLDELNQVKQSNSKQLKKRLMKLSTEKDEEYKTYINKLEHKCDILQNKLNERDEIEGGIGDDVNKKEIKRGSLIFQQQMMSVKQLNDMMRYYKVYGICNAPKILFGNDDVLTQFNEYICYGINITRYRSLYVFRKLMNEEFGVLQKHLLNGYDVIIPLPTPKDVKRYGKERFYKFGKQIIYHRIGISKRLDVPIAFVELIQNKIDELTKYCSSTQIVQCYVYNKTKYKQNVHLMTEQKVLTSKTTQKEAKYSVLWQWRDDTNKWISYDDKTCHKIENLRLNEVYECNANSFITKLSSDSGIYVNIFTEQRRDIKRIKHRSKERKKYIVNWQWKDDDDRWITFKREMSREIEALEIRASYRYSVNTTNGVKRYRITKETRNFGIQIDLETFNKQHVRQTRKEIH